MCKSEWLRSARHTQDHVFRINRDFFARGPHFQLEETLAFGKVRGFSH